MIGSEISELRCILKPDLYYSKKKRYSPISRRELITSEKWILVSVKYENRWEINVILSCCLDKMVFSEFLLGPHVKICPKLSSCGRSPYLQPVDCTGARCLETATGERQYSLRSKDESIRQSTPAWTSWKAPKSLPTTVVFRIIITSITVNFPGHHVSIFNSIKILLVLALINSDCISQNGLFH